MDNLIHENICIYMLFVTAYPLYMLIESFGLVSVLVQSTEKKKKKSDLSFWGMEHYRGKN